MKLLHVGDLHLGKSLGEFDLVEDQKYLLDQILQIADQEDIDAVALAGDIFDKAIPTEAAVNLLDAFLCALAEKKIRTFLISGNHDSDHRLHYGSSLFENSRIYISALFDGTLFMREVPDAYGEVCIWLLPFVKASRVRHFYPEEKIETYEDAVRAVLKHAPIDFTRRNVLVAHQFVTAGDRDPEAAGSEGPSVQSVGLVEKISAGCFDGFDYVALGHIHSPQPVGRETVRYAGSLFKYSFHEVHNEKSVVMVTLEEKGSVHIQIIPLKPMRDLRHLKGPVNKLLAKENITSTEDFIYATLTDEDVVDNAMNILRQVYPNTLKIDYDNAHTRQMEHADLGQIAEARTFSESVRDFYRQMYGCEISDEEMKIMMQAAQEAGITDETD